MSLISPVEKQRSDEGFQTVARVDDVAPGTARCVMLDGHTVALVNAGGTFYALGDTCSHEEASLSDGEVLEDEHCIVCPLHGAEFSLRTGEPLTLPATEPVPTYEVRVEDGAILVRAGT